jgi:hypothetical protein
VTEPVCRFRREDRRDDMPEPRRVPGWWGSCRGWDGVGERNLPPAGHDVARALLRRWTTVTASRVPVPHHTLRSMSTPHGTSWRHLATRVSGFAPTAHSVAGRRKPGRGTGEEWWPMRQQSWLPGSWAGWPAVGGLEQVPDRHAALRGGAPTADSTAASAVPAAVIGAASGAGHGACNAHFRTLLVPASSWEGAR